MYSSIYVHGYGTMDTGYGIMGTGYGIMGTG